MELDKETVASLRNKCKLYNIKPGSKSTKADIIQKIVTRSKTMNSSRSALHDLEATLLKPAFKNPAPLHNFYVAHFNLDDLTDRKWYAVEENHPNHNWCSKIVLGILRFAVYNSWVHGTKAEVMSWKSWRIAVATKLYQYKK